MLFSITSTGTGAALDWITEASQLSRSSGARGVEPLIFRLEIWRDNREGWIWADQR
jgi:hypothetical protein